MDWYQETLRLFSQIPATFWGVVVGSVFSLGGVIASNRANDMRLKRQLENDRDLKAKERELSIKKEVFLSAAEAMSAGIAMLGTYSNLEKSGEELIANYTSKSPAISKAHVIANESTIAALNKLTSELAASILHLSVKRNVLLNKKQEVQMLEKLSNGAWTERDRYLEMIKQYNIAGVPDARKWDVLQTSFTDEQKRAGDLSRKRSELFGQLCQQHAEFAKDCTKEVLKISKIVVPVLVEIRRELELPIDHANYAVMADAVATRMEQEFSKYLGPFNSD